MRPMLFAVAAIAAGLLLPALAAADSIVVRVSAPDSFLVGIFNADDALAGSGIPCSQGTAPSGGSVTFSKSGLCALYSRLSVHAHAQRPDGRGEPSCVHQGLQWNQEVTVQGDAAMVYCVRTN